MERGVRSLEVACLEGMAGLVGDLRSGDAVGPVVCGRAVMIGGAEQQDQSGAAGEKGSDPAGSQAGKDGATSHGGRL